MQKVSGQIWGRPVRNGGQFPVVEAYILPVCCQDEAERPCVDAEGIEFKTTLVPSQKTPHGVVCWQFKENSGMVRVDDETIALPAEITKICYE